MEERRPIAQQYDQSEDAELLRRAYGGDERAFRDIVDRHGRYLTGVAMSMTGHNLADAEDLVQETFVAALTSRFRGESSARTWLVQILVRRVALLRRKRKRERGTPMPGEAERTSPPATAGSDARLDLTEMLQGLTPEQRDVIVLRELEGMTYEQMAETLHVPRGTVESRLHRARAALRELFRGYL